ASAAPPSGLPTAPPIAGLGTIRLPGEGDRVRALDEGTRTETLDADRIGHYSHTAAPGQPGNFAVAGRDAIRTLSTGDIVVVEVPSGSYHYRIDKTEHNVPPQSVDILNPIPARSDYHTPGSYITLTAPSTTNTRSHFVAWGTLLPT
ncbi:sortase, partial [Streptomyces sp. SID3343]|uniref:sortase domain-containing protein n=1 Tax=Streptomyces sp. SID3343 TaxID=2690260 RepID=UPI001367A678